MQADGTLDIAVVGSGIAGLSAAWLLSQRHRVTLFEADDRIGGHSHTVMAGGTPVDTGFIVYNEQTYPNLTALFRHLDVPTKPTEMTFAVSLDRGRLEYSGTDLGGLFAQRRNLASPRFWSMLRDLERFYRRAPRDLSSMGSVGLGDYLDGLGCGAAFRDDHLYPMAAAIWSTPVGDIPDYPAAAFVRFCENHGLLKLGRRPVWRTVDGGSREYVARLTRSFADRISMAKRVRRIRRLPGGVEIDVGGGAERFDHVVIATHADQALAMLGDADAREHRILGAFGYRRNEAVLHSDPSLMPRRRRVWSSWNYASEAGAGAPALSVTYWMNRLQRLPDAHPLFVTLNPIRPPDPSLVHRRDIYDHPVFDTAAGAAQAKLWSLQGVRNTWFCGAYFGAGFHEDGLQAGLAVAEQLGGVRRPWSVDGESDRIQITRPADLAVAA
ncbi:NAD(P)/FAD-dependent oxidoreductase [Sphingomonas sp. CGMCC 1.13654]|uniref:NAD(P)/FAD-dependent oxidoreductase n=2 Tax=Sphingomonas chungangi TaxID=2683589 RepID=A0A838L056_9SPHN|nr:NAD(P)/FAD-dependent oxidoreductase [Sphingomonas chungangi]MBA2932883.1 NAD(P)/FAD-dependent oxidoreductase [Sphingomonas chungangi]MVW56503.1 FAD-dependent oxidoreductase [Sphingomonas chungangi]